MAGDERRKEPGPRPEADDSTWSDAGLPGGTGAAPGEGTTDPTGTHGAHDVD